jgi:hypothetical protein
MIMTPRSRAVLSPEDTPPPRIWPTFFWPVSPIHRGFIAAIYNCPRVKGIAQELGKEEAFKDVIKDKSRFQSSGPGDTY